MLTYAVTAVAAAPANGDANPCAETLASVAALLRAVLAGLPGGGAEHQERMLTYADVC
jgi:hypothetical protein